jgi:hypothetical protein
MRTIGVSQRQSNSQQTKKIRWVCLIQRCIRGTGRSSFMTSSVVRRVGSDWGKEICCGAVGVMKVLFSVGKCSFDSGSDKACPGFEFAAMPQQHAIMDGKFEHLFARG